MGWGRDERDAGEDEDIEKVRDPIIQPNGKDTLFSGRAVSLLRVLAMPCYAVYPAPKKGAFEVR